MFIRLSFHAHINTLFSQFYFNKILTHSQTPYLSAFINFFIKNLLKNLFCIVFYTYICTVKTTEKKLIYISRKKIIKKFIKKFGS
nr:MAG TPA: hypothetical protein [Caudoviricetes sp.]